MALKLMYITNQPYVAQIADNVGVDWVFIDLEIIGKELRQGHLDTVISHHAICDIAPVKQKLKSSKLLVRVNPVHLHSVAEIEAVITAGADIIMLPYYKSNEEAGFFIKTVAGRAQTCLLCETPEAVDIIDETLKIPGIDYIHIGLNDLHLAFKMHFMFEPLTNGLVEQLMKKIKNAGIVCGFGGIARLGEGMLPSEKVIAEHYRLGSEMAILSRSFCNINQIHNRDEVETIFKSGVAAIRNYEQTLTGKPDSWYENNRVEVEGCVKEIVMLMAR